MSLSHPLQLQLSLNFLHLADTPLTTQSCCLPPAFLYFCQPECSWRKWDVICSHKHAACERNTYDKMACYCESILTYLMDFHAQNTSTSTEKPPSDKTAMRRSQALNPGLSFLGGTTTQRAAKPLKLKVKNQHVKSTVTQRSETGNHWNKSTSTHLIISTCGVSETLSDRHTHNYHHFTSLQPLSVSTFNLKED